MYFYLQESDAALTTGPGTRPRRCFLFERGWRPGLDRISRAFLLFPSQLVTIILEHMDARQANRSNLWSLRLT